MSEKEVWRGKVGGMSQAETEEFLAGDWLCRLGCLDDEGWPYVIPCWFEHRDDGFYIIPRARSVWATSAGPGGWPSPVEITKTVSPS